MLCFFMLCCSRKWAKGLLYFFSILVIIAAAISIYASVRLQGYDIFNDQGDPSMQGYNANDANDGQTVKNALFYGTIILDAIVILLGIFGLFTAKRSTCCRVGFYSVTSLLLWLITLAVGVGLFVAMTGASAFID